MVKSSKAPRYLSSNAKNQLLFPHFTIRIRVGVAHCKKKVRKFPVPSRDVTTKLSLGGNNDVITELFLPRVSLVSDTPAGDGKRVNLFLRCSNTCRPSKP
jgi:hypothetical protein